MKVSYVEPVLLKLQAAERAIGRDFLSVTMKNAIIKCISRDISVHMVDINIQMFEEKHIQNCM